MQALLTKWIGLIGVYSGLTINHGISYTAVTVEINNLT